MNNGEALLVILAALYFLPTLIALVRVRTNIMAITALNLLAGWTAVGWIIALIWALSSDKPTVVAAPAETQSWWGMKACPACAERIKKAAKKCRYCGEAV